jgi:transcriptional regulator with XRE-family HTH domain
MTLTRYLRKVVFKMSQQDFAAICKTTQATVSRWERCEGEPGRIELGLLRKEAQKRKLPWDDRWLLDHRLTEKQRREIEAA